jgi:hypothetical protein
VNKIPQVQGVSAPRALGNAVKLHRAGKYEDPGDGLVDPNPK